MLTPKQAELMKLAIKEGCRLYWHKEIEDKAFNFSQETSDVGENDINIRLFNLYLKDSDGTRKYDPVHVHDKKGKNVLHFYVEVFKNHGGSDWLSIDGIFVYDKSAGVYHIFGTIESSNTSKESGSMSISSHHSIIFTDAYYKHELLKHSIE